MSRATGTLSGHPVLGALSPTRASDFLACPKLYQFRAIDRIPERPGFAAARGTLVHEVLDRLFDEPIGARTLDTALSDVPAALDRLLEREPEIAFAFCDDAAWPADEPPHVDDDARQRVYIQAQALLETYFHLENPNEVTPTAREALVEMVLEPDIVLRGYVDRLDDSTLGLRVLDYKTGRSPSQAWEQSAMFQLRFYAMIVTNSLGELPSRLQLMYLGNGEVLTYIPDAEDLRRFERKIRALWKAMVTAAERDDFRPRPSSRCSWCCHQDICPAFTN